MKRIVSHPRVQAYAHVFMIAWQKTFAFRVSTYVQLGIASIMLVSMFYLWGTLFADQTELVGYTKQDMLTYYVLIQYLLASIYAYVPIAQEIRDGDLSKYLTRPMNYLGYHYAHSISRRILQLLLGLPAVIIIFLLFSGSFSIPTSLLSYTLFFFALFQAMTLLFLLDVLLGLMEFWILFSGSITFISDMIVFFLAGSYIPLEFLPGWIQIISDVLPFKYMGAFVVNTFVGRLTISESLTGIVIQMLWIIMFAMMISVVWKRGLRRYEAVGG
mgnify:CR=1 FL=1|jgi:ABC-2 type transport system permease protein